MIKPYYEHAGITIYHGDCRDILSTLPKVDLLLTDPPYGIGFASQPTKGGRRRGQAKEMWDEAPHDAVLGLLNVSTNQCVWGGNYYQLPISRGWLSWFKPDAPPSMGRFELAWTNQDMNTRQISCSIAETNPERLGHPTQKPLKVMLWSINSMPLCETILDPFMGSGTTLRAAKDMGLKAIGIEREERYCEIAANRMAQEVLFA